MTNLAQAATKVEQSLDAGQAPAAAPAPVAPPPKKDGSRPDRGIGVGAAGVGGMVGGIVSGFLNLKGLMPLGVLAIILLISGPSMMLAWLKLRKRNLGPILDANGWAVNAKAKINVPFGASLTSVAALPPGSQRDMVDPFAEKKSPWPKVAVLVVLLVLAYLALDKMGYIYEWTNGRLGEPKRPAPVSTATVTTPAKPAEPAK